MPPIVTLTTDFGYGPYVAQLKAVLLGYCRDVQLVDIAHDIPPQDIAAGATVLADASTRFPEGTYHLAVIDPGVGTGRHLVYVELGGWRYLLPDNGLIGRMAAGWSVERVIRLNQPRFWAPKVSPTFHGRDKLAHVLGHLLQGVDPRAMGDETKEFVSLSIALPTVLRGSIRGEVIGVDRFGNLITNIAQTDFDRIQTWQSADRQELLVRLVGNEVTIRWSVTYGSQLAGTVVGLWDSQGRLEIAVVNGNAARVLELSVGSPVEVVFGEEF